MSAVIRALQAEDASSCERILRALPDWFGIEGSLVQYVQALASAEAYIAAVDGTVAGFLALKHHNPRSAEIHVIAVAKEHHGRGIGRALVEHAERVLRSRSVEFLEVKTLGPSRPDAYYARTRGFYEHVGFRPLEENDLWGAVNPCLIMVKHLACGGGGACEVIDVEPRVPSLPAP